MTASTLRRLGSVILGGLLAVGGCDGDTGNGGAGGTSAGATTEPPGRCAPSDPACPAVNADCLALVDHAAAPQFTLRMSQLSVLEPPSLTGDLLYGVIGDGVNINLPTCNVSGRGTFCWLLQFDADRGTLKTGGARPREDPTDGYCFELAPAEEIAPIEIEAPLQADGSFEAGPMAFLNIPIYLDMAAQYMTRLPLHEVTITDAAVSADHNCIGSFNDDGLDPANNCRPDLQAGIEYFLNGATLQGYISLAEADGVVVDLINQSLCVLLSGDATTYGDGQTPMHCLRDGSGAIVLEGDWCSETNEAGGCRDAMHLSAGIAASAVPLADDCTAG